jgi:hypothetical protein
MCDVKREQQLLDPTPVLSACILAEMFNYQGDS